MEDYYPSEIARLVLGYLCEVKCMKTWHTFLEESGDLREHNYLLKQGKSHSTDVRGESLLAILKVYPALKILFEQIICQHSWQEVLEDIIYLQEYYNARKQAYHSTQKTGLSIVNSLREWILRSSRASSNIENELFSSVGFQKSEEKSKASEKRNECPNNDVIDSSSDHEATQNKFSLLNSSQQGIAQISESSRNCDATVHYSPESSLFGQPQTLLTSKNDGRSKVDKSPQKKNHQVEINLFKGISVLNNPHDSTENLTSKDVSSHLVELSQVTKFHTDKADCTDTGISSNIESNEIGSFDVENKIPNLIEPDKSAGAYTEKSPLDNNSCIKTDHDLEIIKDEFDYHKKNNEINVNDTLKIISIETCDLQYFNNVPSKLSDAEKVSTTQENNEAFEKGESLLKNCPTNVLDQLSTVNSSCPVENNTVVSSNVELTDRIETAHKISNIVEFSNKVNCQNTIDQIKIGDCETKENTLINDAVKSVNGFISVNDNSQYSIISSANQSNTLLSYATVPEFAMPNVSSDLSGQYQIVLNAPVNWNVPIANDLPLVPSEGLSFVPSLPLSNASQQAIISAAAVVPFVSLAPEHVLPTVPPSSLPCDVMQATVANSNMSAAIANDGSNMANHEITKTDLVIKSKTDFKKNSSCKQKNTSRKQQKVKKGDENEPRSTTGKRPYSKRLPERKRLFFFDSSSEHKNISPQEIPILSTLVSSYISDQITSKQQKGNTNSSPIKANESSYKTPDKDSKDPVTPPNQSSAFKYLSQITGKFEYGDITSVLKSLIAKINMSSNKKSSNNSSDIRCLDFGSISNTQNKISDSVTCTKNTKISKSTLDNSDAVSKKSSRIQLQKTTKIPRNKSLILNKHKYVLRNKTRLNKSLQNNISFCKKKIRTTDKNECKTSHFSHNENQPLENLKIIKKKESSESSMASNTNIESLAEKVISCEKVILQNKNNSLKSVKITSTNVDKVLPPPKKRLRPISVDSSSNESFSSAFTPLLNNSNINKSTCTVSAESNVKKDAMIQDNLNTCEATFSNKIKEKSDETNDLSVLNSLPICKTVDLINQSSVLEMSVNNFISPSKESASVLEAENPSPKLKLKSVSSSPKLGSPCPTFKQPFTWRSDKQGAMAEIYKNACPNKVNELPVSPASFSNSSSTFDAFPAKRKFLEDSPLKSSKENSSLESSKEVSYNASLCIQEEYNSNTDLRCNSKDKNKKKIIKKNDTSTTDSLPVCTIIDLNNQKHNLNTYLIYSNKNTNQKKIIKEKNNPKRPRKYSYDPRSIYNPNSLYIYKETPTLNLGPQIKTYSKSHFVKKGSSNEANDASVTNSVQPCNANISKILDLNDQSSTIDFSSPLKETNAVHEAENHSSKIKSKLASSNPKLVSSYENSDLITNSTYDKNDTIQKEIVKENNVSKRQKRNIVHNLDSVYTCKEASTLATDSHFKTYSKSHFVKKHSLKFSVDNDVLNKEEGRKSGDSSCSDTCSTVVDFENEIITPIKSSDWLKKDLFRKPTPKKSDGIRKASSSSYESDISPLKLDCVENKTNLSPYKLKENNIRDITVNSTIMSESAKEITNVCQTKLNTSMTRSSSNVHGCNLDIDIHKSDIVSVNKKTLKISEAEKLIQEQNKLEIVCSQSKKLKNSFDKKEKRSRSTLRKGSLTYPSEKKNNDKKKELSFLDSTSKKIVKKKVSTIASKNVEPCDKSVIKEGKISSKSSKNISKCSKDQSSNAEKKRIKSNSIKFDQATKAILKENVKVCIADNKNLAISPRECIEITNICETTQDIVESDIGRSNDAGSELAIAIASCEKELLISKTGHDPQSHRNQPNLKLNTPENLFPNSQEAKSFSSQKEDSEDSNFKVFMDKINMLTPKKFSGL